jgi:hypothetical protein
LKSDLVETFKINAFNAFVLDRVIGPFGTCNGSLLVLFGWSTSVKLGTKLLFSTSHLKTDGQIEVVNKTVTLLLHVVIQKNLKNWEDCLPFIEFAYNYSVHSTTGFSPFEIVYGFNHLTLTNLILFYVDESVILDGNRKALVVKTLQRVCGNKLKRRTVCMQLKPIKGANMLSFSPAIGFGYICTRSDFQPIGNPSYIHEKMSHFRSLRGSMTVLIKLVC